MTIVADPLKRAHNVTTPLQARRLREELEVELALNDDLPGGWEAEADKAVDVLNERYGSGTLDDIDPEGQGRKGWSPGTSPGAKKGLDGPKLAKPAAATKPSRPAAPKASPRGGRRSPSGGGRRRRGGIFSGKAARQTGIPAAARSASAMALQTFGLLIFLSVAYLLLRNAQGSAGGKSAVELFGKSVSGFVRAVVAPVDPLRGRAVKPAASTVQSTGAGSLQDANALLGASVAQALSKAGPSIPRRRGAVHPNP